MTMESWLNKWKWAPHSSQAVDDPGSEVIGVIIRYTSPELAILNMTYLRQEFCR